MYAQLFITKLSENVTTSKLARKILDYRVS